MRWAMSAREDSIGELGIESVRCAVNLEIFLGIQKSVLNRDDCEIDHQRLRAALFEPAHLLIDEVKFQLV